MTGADEGVGAEVWELLNRRPRQLSPKWFYDVRGSELFEEITRLDEYYPTRTEQALLERWARPWMSRLAPQAVVELGAGSARKTRVLLDAMLDGGERGVYVPLDVSAGFLDETARTLRSEYPSLEVVPEVADLTRRLRLSTPVPRPALVALLGSTIGNFPGPTAGRLLGHVAELLEAEDRFLMGADLRPGPGKSKAALEAAYNDARGITAEFNLNMLSVLNRLAGTDFDPAGFDHLAYYDEDEGRIEMHVVARGTQRVTVPGHGTVEIPDGESVRTEISCKYDRETVDAMFHEAGLALDEWVTDDRGRYALALGRLAA